MKKEKERSVNSAEDDTQTSSPGGWQAKLSALNFLHLQVSRRGTACSSRASSRKSSRASDASDLSELAGPWLNLPLMLVSGADELVKDLKEESAKRGSILMEPPKSGRRRSFYNFFLRHQDAVDDSLASPSVQRKSLTPTTSEEKPAPPASRKRATSFIRKKPPLERGLSAQSALRVNKNAFVSDGPSEVSIMVTKPSPEAPTGPSLRPDNSTLVHVLVHRESEEYKNDEDENIDNNLDKSKKPPDIKITPGSDELSFSGLAPDHPIVQIMVESPKEPPSGDFSTQSDSSEPDREPEADYTKQVVIDVDEPIDVNVQGDTSQVFYHYNESENDVDNEKENVTTTPTSESMDTKNTKR